MSSSTPKVAVIGLGPSAVYAARAAVDMKADVTIYARVGGGNTPPGAFWLHWIPDTISLCPRYPIRLTGIGSEAIYRAVQWGHRVGQVPDSSFPVIARTEYGYNPKEVLPILMPKEVRHINLTSALTDNQVLELSKEYDFVFQSFPSQASLAVQPPYISYCVYSEPSADEVNYVTYNGTGYDPYVRMTQLWGTFALEFKKDMSEEEIMYYYAPDFGTGTLTKLRDLDPTTPRWISYNNIHYIGRWATWDRKVLTHDAYATVTGALQ